MLIRVIVLSASRTLVFIIPPICFRLPPSDIVFVFKYIPHRTHGDMGLQKSRFSYECLYIVLD